MADDTTMRQAMRALASPSRPKEPKAEPEDDRTPKPPAGGRIPAAEEEPAPIEDEERIADAEVLEQPRAGPSKTCRRTRATVPARLGAVERALDEAAGDHLDDHGAGEALYAASREAHQAAIDPEQIGAALAKRAA